MKVLDFGLAKAFQPDASDPSLSQSPTISLTAAATQMGMVIGTAAYMSPEQAKGKTVDKRADVWAFGTVLFEILTGRKMFGAGDVSDTLAYVLTKEIRLDDAPRRDARGSPSPVAAVPRTRSEAPPPVHRRCMARTGGRLAGCSTRRTSRRAWRRRSPASSLAAADSGSHRRVGDRRHHRSRRVGSGASCASAPWHRHPFSVHFAGRRCHRFR